MEMLRRAGTGTSPQASGLLTRSEAWKLLLSIAGSALKQADVQHGGFCAQSHRTSATTLWLQWRAAPVDDR